MTDPLKDWYADETNRRELAAALDLPILKSAMTVLQWLALPRADTTERGSADAITRDALDHRHAAGFFSYPETLKRLTELPDQRPEAPEGYSDDYVKAYARKHGLLDDQTKG